MFFPKSIIIHHSATEDGPSFSTGAIRKYHKEHNGWIDIGYHALVELVNSEHEIMIGRSWLVKGAHTIGYNGEALGLCLVGDFNKCEPPHEQLVKAAIIINIWRDMYDITPNQIYRHKDLNNTDCPGKYFDINNLISLL